MKIVGSFNKISDELKKKIIPLKKGENAHYRMLNGVYDVASGEVRYGSMFTIVCRDTVQDGDNIATIGVPREIKDGEVALVKKFYIAPIGDNILNNGVFTLQGGSLEHQEFYEFFELCNFNKSNKSRDESIVPLFERIDEVAEAEGEEADIDELTKALVIAAGMSASDVKTFAAGKNWNVREHIAILRKRVKKYAQEYPSDFIAAQDDPEQKTKVVIKAALDANIISYVPHEHKIVWADGKTLALLDKPENGESEVELFLAWVLASKNGENIIKSINTRLKKSAE